MKLDLLFLSSPQLYDYPLAIREALLDELERTLMEEKAVGLDKNFAVALGIGTHPFHLARLEQEYIQSRHGSTLLEVELEQSMLRTNLLLQTLTGTMSLLGLEYAYKENNPPVNNSNLNPKVALDRMEMQTITGEHYNYINMSKGTSEDKGLIGHDFEDYLTQEKSSECTFY